VRRRAAVTVLFSLAVACSAPQVARPPRGPLTARDYLPLRLGAAWSYDTATGFGGGTVLSAMTVVRAGGEQFLVRTDGRTATYEIRPDGVVREGEYYVKDPVRVGATWAGRDGAQFEIRGVDGTRTVNGNPSPSISTTSEFGQATLAPIAAGSPKPIVPRPLDDSHVRGSR
jgi:hypothetical protein